MAHLPDPQQHFATAHTENIVCPWCGHEHDDLTDLYPPEGETEGETDCKNCDKSFCYTMDLTVAWYTRKPAEPPTEKSLPLAAELTGLDTEWKGK